VISAMISFIWMGGLLRDLKPFLIALFFAIGDCFLEPVGVYFLYGFLWKFSGFGRVVRCNILGWTICYLDWLHFWIWEGFSRYFSEGVLGFTGVF
jgi:hypothetical protein